MNKAIALVAASLCLFAGTSAYAQTQKGNQMLGLGFGVSTSKSTNSYLNLETNTWGPEVTVKNTSFNIAPAYSYFIADKLDVGVSLSYSHGKLKNSDNELYLPSRSTANIFAGTIALRKYFLFEDKIGIRTGPYFSYNKTNVKNEVDDPNTTLTERNNGYAGGIGLDFVYYPSKNIGLAATLGDISYRHQKSKYYTSSTTNEFKLSFTNSLMLSVYYVFGN